MNSRHLKFEPFPSLQYLTSSLVPLPLHTHRNARSWQKNSYLHLLRLSLVNFHEIRYLVSFTKRGGNPMNNYLWKDGKAESPWSVHNSSNKYSWKYKTRLLLVISLQGFASFHCIYRASLLSLLLKIRTFWMF